MMLDHGNAYDHGMIGAEIAHSIVSNMLMGYQLVISEPARGGPDVFSSDGHFAVEARMLTRTRFMQGRSLINETFPHFRQMIRRIRWETSTRTYRRGFAVLSVQLENQIVALIKET